jgi:predicted nucleotidyltransferase
MKLQLEPRWIQVVKTILKKYVPHKDVLVFGSRVTNTFKPHSDLDLCVISQHPMPLEQLALLREAFSESDLPVRVDIVDWATTTPDFRRIITENAYPLDLS